VSESITAAIGGFSLVTLIFVVMGQLAGKSLIKKVWSAFLNLQILMTVYYHNPDRYSANVDSAMKQLQSVLELDALPKDKIKDFLMGQYLKDKIMPEGGLLD